MNNGGFPPIFNNRIEIDKLSENEISKFNKNKIIYKK